MHLLIDRHGQVVCVYGEALDLAALGAMMIRRAGSVESDGEGRWWADLSPVDGPRLGPYALRSQALDAEADWLRRHLFARQGPGPAPCAVDA